ncbi:MAG: insulinase family protein [Clostridia bacterium]|nr:insulinase family protein [Clostridia bacterium]
MEEKRITASGIPVYVYQNPALHGFCLSLYVRAGSMYEAEENSGETHLIEHMVFRNINYCMNGGLYPLLDRCGLSFNAETYKEFVQFYIVGAKEHFSDAVTVFSHLFDPMVLPREQIAPERLRVKSEIRESDEGTSLDYFSDGIVWNGTSLARSILGRAGTLDRMGSKFLANAARRIFSRNNLFFYVTGAVSQEGLEAFCAALSFPVAETVPTRSNIAPLPANFGNRPRTVFLKNSDETVVRFSFDFDSEKYTNAELMLLYDILFYGECGKVYRELSDKRGLIYSFDPCLERYRNGGALHLKYEVRPSNLVRSVEIVCEILQGLKAGLTDELEYVLPLYLDNAGLLFDNAEEFNWNRAYEVHILDCPYPDHAARRAAFASVSPQRISEIAREIFRTCNLTLALKGNRQIKLDQLVKITDVLG